MLKIKDNVDLKELEKFGFIEIDDTDNRYIYDNPKKRNVGLIILKENNKRYRQKRGQLSFVTMDTKSLDAVYDLIKADLVEKVED